MRRWLRPRRVSRPARARMVAVILLAVTLRTLIPPGFMPASDGSLSLTLCPDGLPAWFLPHPLESAHHGRGHSRTDHCIFCSGCPAGLLPAASVLPPVRPLPLYAVAIRESYPNAFAGVSFPRARSPPSPM